MITPTVFQRVRRDDFTITPFTVHKDFFIGREHVENTGSGYSVKQGYYYSKPLAIGYNTTFVTQAPISQDGSYNYLNWRSINHLYYNNPYDYSNTLEGVNQNITYKHLYLTASIISSPYLDIGEGFKPGSVKLTGSLLTLADDSNGNLYDTSINTGYFIDDSYLDAYWGFQELYRKTEKGYTNILTDSSEYISNTFGDGLSYRVNKVKVSPGVKVGSIPTGAQIDFTQSSSYVFTRNNPTWDYENDDNFTLSFWMKAPVSQSNTDTVTNTLINKRTYTDVAVYGSAPIYLDDSNVTVDRVIIGTEEQKLPTDIYPYHFEIYNQTAEPSLVGKISFKRSDGSAILHLTSSNALNDSEYHHVCAVKSSTTVNLYVDGVLQGSKVDVTEQPTNGYHLIFGAEDLNNQNQYSGSLDEIRFYNIAGSGLNVSRSLAEKEAGLLYQTANVGNVFYKRGEVVLTSPISKYHENFRADDWELRYKNRYTIYEYETLVRIPSGEYNRTMNPSSTRSPKSDLYLTDFITGSLYPYATSVGLYNDKFELIAVGKFGRPLKMRNDVNMNVIIRWDY